MGLVVNSSDDLDIGLYSVRRGGRRLWLEQPAGQCSYFFLVSLLMMMTCTKAITLSLLCSAAVRPRVTSADLEACLVSPSIPHRRKLN